MVDAELIPGSLMGGFESIRIEYPDLCWNAGIDGTVILFIDISESGEATDVRVTRGIGGGCMFPFPGGYGGLPWRKLFGAH